jgi:two-component system cell cycle response regulator
MSGNILFVASVATNHISFGYKLRKAHYQVHVINSLKDIESLSDHLIWNAIIIDVDYASDIQYLENLPNTDKTPIIATSHKNSSSFRLSVLKAGADQILAKPVCEKSLLARLRSLIRMRHTNSKLNVREDTNRALGFWEAETGLVTV